MNEEEEDRTTYYEMESFAHKWGRNIFHAHDIHIMLDLLYENCNEGNFYGTFIESVQDWITNKIDL